MILFAPLMLFVALLISILDPGPIFYTQQRIGFAGQKFRIFKFRTMCVNADQALAGILATDGSACLDWDTRQKLADDPELRVSARFCDEAASTNCHNWPTFYSAT